MAEFTIEDGKLIKCKGNDVEIVVPDDVTIIGRGAFVGCKKLKNVVIPNGITTIENRAFAGCKALESIVIPDSVSIIKEKVFYECESLLNVSLPYGITSIENETFRGCKSMVGVIIPNTVASIGCSAFYDCKSLTSVEIPESVKSIGECAFYGCGLENIKIPEGFISIDSGTFYECKSLTSVEIPESVTSIGDSAFYGCELENIKIPESVTSIGNNAFGRCLSLNDIVIPESVTSIGKDCVSPRYYMDSVTGKTVLYIKNISLLNDSVKPNAVMGFIDNYEDYSEKDVNKYLKYIKKNTLKLMHDAINDVRLLKIILENDCLSFDVIEAYIGDAEKLNSLEAKTLLLEYRNNKSENEVSDLSLGDSLEAMEVGIVGKKFAIAGRIKALHAFSMTGSQERAKEFIEARGGKVTASLSSKTDYLICNDISSLRFREMVDKARGYGIKIINEDELFDMIGERPKPGLA